MTTWQKQPVPPGLAHRKLTRRAAIRAGGVGVAAGVAGVVAPRFASAQDATPSVPGDAPLPERIAAALGQLDTIVEDLMGRTDIPGAAVTVVADDEVVHLKGYGVRDAAGTDPIDEDTRFQLASVSKPFASTVVASVIGDGAITWDTPIQTLTPEFALYDAYPSAEVTLRDMFCHRSGLPDHAGDLLEDIGYDRETVLHRLRYQPPRSSFRSQYDYTNFGVTAAAIAAASTTGQSWEDLSVSRLYEPLGMSRTSSRFADFIGDDNRARSHVQANGAWQTLYVREPDAQSPAGGVSSTARDFAQFMRLHLGGGMVDGVQVVAAEPLTETLRPQVISEQVADPIHDRPAFYGLGWNVGYSAAGYLQLGHSGAFAAGVGTTVYLIPEIGLGIAVLTNAFPVGVAESIALSFLEVVQTGAITVDYLGIIGPLILAQAVPPYATGIDYSALPADSVAALAADAYVGTYHNDFFGELRISEGAAGLEMVVGPAANPRVFPIQHYNRDVFWFQPTGENAGPPSAITFMVDGDGTASTVRVDIFDIHGEGTFTRVTAANEGEA